MDGEECPEQIEARALAELGKGVELFDWKGVDGSYDFCSMKKKDVVLWRSILKGD